MIEVSRYYSPGHIVQRIVDGLLELPRFCGVRCRSENGRGQQQSPHRFHISSRHSVAIERTVHAAHKPEYPLARIYQDRDAFGYRNHRQIRLTILVEIANGQCIAWVI